MVCFPMAIAAFAGRSHQCARLEYRSRLRPRQDCRSDPRAAHGHRDPAGSGSQRPPHRARRCRQGTGTTLGLQYAFGKAWQEVNQGGTDDPAYQGQATLSRFPDPRAAGGRICPSDRILEAAAVSAIVVSAAAPGRTHRAGDGVGCVGAAPGGLQPASGKPRTRLQPLRTTEGDPRGCQDVSGREPRSFWRAI